MAEGKKKYLQKCKSDYLTEFPCLKKSQRGENYVFCGLCYCDFSIAHGAKRDITQHFSTDKHLNMVAASKKTNKISNFFSNTSKEDAVIRAECLFTCFIVEHNLPLSCADHVGSLLRKMFPDNEIVKKYGCARTKTSAIISEFAAASRKKLVDSLKEQPFCLATDGTNDTDSKIYPMVVTYFDKSCNKIQPALLAVPTLIGNCTGQNIGNLMIQKLEECDIPIANCIAFGADNAAVMIGKKNGVAAVLRQKNEHLIVIGCLCHLLNLAIEKGAACLPLNIDELLVDIYYYIDKSSKRKETLQMFEEFYNCEIRKILKHVATRWLSTTKCLERVISLWVPLIQFFKSEIEKENNKSNNLKFYTIPKKENNEVKSTDKNFQNKNKESKKRNVSCRDDFVDNAKKKSKVSTSDQKGSLSALSRPERLFYLLSSDVNKAYCLFILYVNPIFDKMNTALQSQAPRIHILRTMLLEFFKEILCKFVQTSVIKQSSDILTVDYHSSGNQRCNDDLLIGERAKNVINELTVKEKTQFFICVKQFYVTTCDYMVHKFPFKDAVLLHAGVCNFKNIEHSSFSSVRYFLDKFPVLLKGKNVDEEIDILQSEFATLQVTEVSENIRMEERIDSLWVSIGQLENELYAKQFKNIADIMLGILSIPHSNAECERIFSKVKKIRTDFRSSLSDEKLESLLLMKSNFSGNCYDQNFDKNFLTKAKSATYVSNM